MDEKNTSEKINVLFISPGKHAEMREIGETLEDMQKAVGGYIEEYMPFEDDVALVCNEEGKMLGLPLNRGITDEKGQLQDIIAGDFFICYAPLESEKFLSLPPDLEEKYKEKFASSAGSAAPSEKGTSGTGKGSSKRNRKGKGPDASKAARSNARTVSSKRLSDRKGGRNAPAKKPQQAAASKKQEQKKGFLSTLKSLFGKK